MSRRATVHLRACRLLFGTARVRCCEDFRMPAARKRCCSRRRPAYENLQRRKSREEIRWRVLHRSARAEERVNVNANPARTHAQLQRSGTSIANGESNFRFSYDSKELGVAKIAHSTTPARRTSSGTFAGIAPINFLRVQNPKRRRDKTLLSRSSTVRSCSTANAAGPCARRGVALMPPPITAMLIPSLSLLRSLAPPVP